MKTKVMVSINGYLKYFFHQMFCGSLKNIQHNSGDLISTFGTSFYYFHFFFTTVANGDLLFVFP